MPPTTFPIDVAASGVVHLGPRVVCDGFYYDARARIQTHVHDDHMDDFEASKGFQYMLMSPETKALLVAERNADLPYRDNIKALAADEHCAVDVDTVQLLPNGHMLGSVQASVRLPTGVSLGYSGDFSWPLTDVMQVDALVVDSTYGSPQHKREYSQADVEARFLELVTSLLHKGPVHIRAHRGTLHRALQTLAGQVNCRLLGSPRLIGEASVYRKFGCAMDELVLLDSAEGREASKERAYIRFVGKGDGLPVRKGASEIVLSAFMSKPDDPVLEYSDSAFRVALSDHADFDGTVEYVKATGAKYVVTDNTRGGNAVVLAQELRARLAVDAVPSTNETTREWTG